MSQDPKTRFDQLTGSEIASLLGLKTWTKPKGEGVLRLLQKFNLHQDDEYVIDWEAKVVRKKTAEVEMPKVEGSKMHRLREAFNKGGQEIPTTQLVEASGYKHHEVLVGLKILRTRYKEPIAQYTYDRNRKMVVK